MVPPVLWHIEVSHYNEKARWALDYKRIPHVRKAPMPGLHGLWALAITRGAQRRVPVLQLEGRRIGDSTAIIEALEAYQPDPSLYPDDDAERKRAPLQRRGPDRRRTVHPGHLPSGAAVRTAALPRADHGGTRGARSARRRQVGARDVRAAPRGVGGGGRLSEAYRLR